MNFDSAVCETCYSQARDEFFNEILSHCNRIDSHRFMDSERPQRDARRDVIWESKAMIHSAFTRHLCTLVWLAAASIGLFARVDFGADRLLEDEVIAKSANILNASDPLFSPDGKKIAFVRPVLDPNAFNMRGEPTYRHDLWVRDLSDGEETLIRENTMPSFWVSNSALAVNASTAVDVKTKKEVPLAPAAKLPEKLTTRQVEWSPDRSRLVYIPDVMFYRVNNLTQPFSGPNLYEVNLGGKTRELSFGANVDSDESGVLAYSPDGKRLAFNLYFFRNGNTPLFRAGVVDLASGVARFVGESANPGGGLGVKPNPWDAHGNRFLAILNHDGAETDVFVSSADGSETRRVTNDGSYKTVPAFDPSGRRVAYCAAERSRKTNITSNARVEVVDLLTGKRETIKPPHEVDISILAWFPDGSGLVYCLFENHKPRIVEVKLQPPPAMPEGAPEATQKPDDFKSQVFAALASGKDGSIGWGAEHAVEIHDPAAVPALREALKSLAKLEYPHATREVLETLRILNARDAAPEVIDVFSAPYEPWRNRAIALISEWKDKRAIEPLRTLLAKSPSTRTGVVAAAALANLGDENIWPQLKLYAASKDKELRGDLASDLKHVRDPRAVEMLIEQLADTDVLYLDYTGDVQVGDHALNSLVNLTGEMFGRDSSRWREWWKKQNRQLPEVTEPNKGLEALTKEIKVKGERRQKELNEGR
jgi:dipeptidyl aminopeptidase/acylaminoacyl peptidase